MKKSFLIIMILIAVAYANQSTAQIRLSLNIGSQPCWGPTGYDHAEYYYLPDIECYYNVPKHRFVYQDGGRWIFSPTLPPMYANYNLNTGYKVVMNEEKPYMHFAEHRDQYSRYRGNAERQPILHESTEDRYRNHWDDKRYGMRDNGDHRDGDHRDGDHHDRH